MSMPGGTVTIADAVVVPTLVVAAHWSAVNFAAAHLSGAFGSPDRPCGRITVIDFTSSLVGFSSKARSTVTSGWPPAVVVDGVSLTFVSVAAASDEAGNASAARHA